MKRDRSRTKHHDTGQSISLMEALAVLTPDLALGSNVNADDGRKSRAPTVDMDQAADAGVVDIGTDDNRTDESMRLTHKTRSTLSRHLSQELAASLAAAALTPAGHADTAVSAQREDNELNQMPPAPPPHSGYCEPVFMGSSFGPPPTYDSGAVRSARVPTHGSVPPPPPPRVAAPPPHPPAPHMVHAHTAIVSHAYDTPAPEPQQQQQDTGYGDEDADVDEKNGASLDEDERVGIDPAVARALDALPLSQHPIVLEAHREREKLNDVMNSGVCYYAGTPSLLV